MRIELPVANGVRSDHPVPNLPFVDDSHLPIHDGEAIEAQGRPESGQGWGRHDRDSSDKRRWTAFTDDQFNPNFAWAVRNDPDYGRTVLLYANADAVIMHEHGPRPGDRFLYRAGGYWWDGTTWYRPPAMFDRALERAVVVPVPDAVSITAAEYLAAHPGNAKKAKFTDITTFTPRMVDDDQWRHDLAYWAACRPADARPLTECIVDVSAPELQPDALVSKSAAAREIGLSPDEINEAINAHGGGRAERFPFPQAYTPRTRSPRWSKPVLREWAWERQRANPEPVVAHLRRGNERLDPDELIYTITYAVLWQMRQTYEPDKPFACALGLPLERAIGRVVTEQPQFAEALFGNIVDKAREELKLPDDTIERTLRDAVHWGARDTDDQDEALDEFLRRTLPPSLTRFLP